MRIQTIVGVMLTSSEHQCDCCGSRKRDWSFRSGYLVCRGCYSHFSPTNLCPDLRRKVHYEWECRPNEVPTPPVLWGMYMKKLWQQ